MQLAHNNSPVYSKNLLNSTANRPIRLHGLNFPYGYSENVGLRCANPTYPADDGRINRAGVFPKRRIRWLL